MVNKLNIVKNSMLVMVVALACVAVAKPAFADTSPSVLYVPLIGITSVPYPLALPDGAGNVTYRYAVKNFITEMDFVDVKVIDNACNLVTFTEGDDNGDRMLNYSETWRYSCTTLISHTTESTATVTGIAHGITAMDKAYATVVVGSKDPAPLVSIINITKVSYPLSLPPEGGSITFIYRVNNPGILPLSNVSVVDDKCARMSSKLGDTNNNGLIDTNEVWLYTCTTTLQQTTTNTATVTAFANGLKAIDSYTLTVKVAAPGAEANPIFPDTGTKEATYHVKIIIWSVLFLLLLALALWLFFLNRKKP